MKKCTRCKQDKPLSDFRVNNKAKDGLTTWCRPCFAVYDRERYQNGDNVRVRKNHVARIERNRAVVKEYLLAHPCEDCGDSDWWNLDFDHRDRADKTLEVSTMVRDRGMQSLLDEIAKCVVRCTKCHRRRTIEQMGWWRTIT
jgi:hypothetical protein